MKKIEKLSVVTSIYRSAAHVEEFHFRMSKCAQDVAQDYEIIFVNDGSPDNSIEIIESLASKDHHVKVVDFSRNFGHHIALMTGLSYVSGTHVFMLDDDLEEEPEILYMYTQEFFSRKDIDVVYGVQPQRKGDFFEKLSGKIFYKAFNYLAHVKVPNNICTARLMTRQFVDSLVQFKERELFIAGLCVLNGFNSHQVYVEKKSTSVSSYSFSKKISLLINGITSLSNRPLYLIFYLGVFITIASFIFAAYVFFLRVTNQTTIDGWTTLSMLIVSLGGFNIFCVGIIGIYLSKIYTEVKQRPYSVVKRKINFEK